MVCCYRYTGTDDATGTATATVNVTVTANPPPEAVADTATTDEDTTVSIDVLANDSDPLGETVSIVAVTAQGTLGVATVNAGQIDYAPNADANGTDVFTYSITDGAGGINTANVTVTINPVNDAPSLQTIRRPPMKIWRSQSASSPTMAISMVTPLRSTPMDKEHRGRSSTMATAR